MYLAIDIGGTKATLATYRPPKPGTAGVGPRHGDVSRFASRDHGALGLGDMIARHQSVTSGALQGIGIGVAGPVLGRQVRLTNLPWVIDADALEQQFNAPVFLLNDLEAYAASLAGATPADLLTLQAGKPRPGNRALIAAGTGLGEAIAFWDGNNWHPSASEGGHATFGPPTGDDLALLDYLQRRYGHVSWERVVSGLDGIRNVAMYHRDSGRSKVPPPPEDAAGGDWGPFVIGAALAGSAWAEQVMDDFMRLYGAEAGNLALKAMAVGGVFVGGGIADRMRSWFAEGGRGRPRFLEAFADKGRFRSMLRDVPVYLLLDPEAPLKGAAAHTAARTMGRG